MEDLEKCKNIHEKLELVQNKINEGESLIDELEEQLVILEEYKKILLKDFKEESKHVLGGRCCKEHHYDPNDNRISCDSDDHCHGSHCNKSCEGKLYCDISLI